MSDRHIFHLSFPVADLELARDFYVDVLGASVGRTNPGWLDILLWGHQITLQLRPAEPKILYTGTAQEQAKFHLADPSHNVIEVKAYRSVSDTLLLSPTQSPY